MLMGAETAGRAARGLSASSAAAASALSSAAAAGLRWARSGSPARSAPLIGGPLSAPREPDPPPARVPAPRVAAPPSAVGERAPQPRAPEPIGAGAEPAPHAARARRGAAGAAWRPVALWWLRVAVLVQVAFVLVRSAAGGAATAAPAGTGLVAGIAGGAPVWPILAVGGVQAAAAAAIAVRARTSRWPAVFSVLLVAGGVVQGRLDAAEPLYLLSFGAVLVAPGLWVALWAWGWRWPDPGGPGAASGTQLFQDGS
ncbi:hypothetical protein GCM10023405_20670 [Streptomonospora salina]